VANYKFGIEEIVRVVDQIGFFRIKHVMDTSTNTISDLKYSLFAINPKKTIIIVKSESALLKLSDSEKKSTNLLYN